MPQTSISASGATVCAGAALFGATILVGLFSIMLAVARHDEWCPCQVEADEAPYLEPDDGLPSRLAVPKHGDAGPAAGTDQD